MKQRIKNYLLRNLLKAVITEDIVTKDPKKGTIFLGGKRITDNELRQLQAESKALRGFRLWSIMTSSVRHIAQDKLFNRALTFDEVMAGKLMLFNLDTIESIAKTFTEVI